MTILSNLFPVKTRWIVLKKNGQTLLFQKVNTFILYLVFLLDKVCIDLNPTTGIPADHYKEERSVNCWLENLQNGRFEKMHGEKEFHSRDAFDTKVRSNGFALEVRSLRVYLWVPLFGEFLYITMLLYDQDLCKCERVNRKGTLGTDRLITSKIYKKTEKNDTNEHITGNDLH